jgi:hypothetical protein
MTENTETPVRRGPERPPLRPELREPIRQEGRDLPPMGLSLDEDEDLSEFKIPGHYFANGWDYQWKTYSIYGKEDPYYISKLKRRHWEEVQAETHPDIALPGQTGAIIKGGLILMRRPRYLTDQAKAREEAKARQVMGDKLQQLGLAPPGTLPRTADPRTAPKVKTSYEPIPEE